MVSFEPPYSAVSGFSYIFDQLLPAGDTFSFMIRPPMADDHCYTQFEANGPIGAFTTVDVGDYMEFRRTSTNNVNADSTAYGSIRRCTRSEHLLRGTTKSRSRERTHLVPNPDAPDDALSMVEETYRFNNFPLKKFPLTFQVDSHSLTSRSHPFRVHPLQWTQMFFSSLNNLVMFA